MQCRSPRARSANGVQENENLVCTAEGDAVIWQPPLSARQRGHVFNRSSLFDAEGPDGSSIYNLGRQAALYAEIMEQRPRGADMESDAPPSPPAQCKHGKWRSSDLADANGCSVARRVSTPALPRAASAPESWRTNCERDRRHTLGIQSAVPSVTPRKDWSAHLALPRPEEMRATLLRGHEGAVLPSSEACAEEPTTSRHHRCREAWKLGRGEACTPRRRASSAGARREDTIPREFRHLSTQLGIWDARIHLVSPRGSAALGSEVASRRQELSSAVLGGTAAAWPSHERAGVSDLRALDAGDFLSTDTRLDPHAAKEQRPRASSAQTPRECRLRDLSSAGLLLAGGERHAQAQAEAPSASVGSPRLASRALRENPRRRSERNFSDIFSGASDGEPRQPAAPSPRAPEPRVEPELRGRGAPPRSAAKPSPSPGADAANADKPAPGPNELSVGERRRVVSRASQCSSQVLVGIGAGPSPWYDGRGPPAPHWRADRNIRKNCPPVPCHGGAAARARYIESFLATNID